MTHRLILLWASLWLLSTPATALELIFEAASAETLGEPHDIVLSGDGKKLYVADNAKHRIVVLDAMTLAERGVFGQGELSAPHDVVFDARGQLLVADTGHSRIAIYTLTGDSGRLSGELRGAMSRPEGVTVASDGRVLATGAASGNLVVFEGGKVTAQVGGFSSPHDVEIAPDGTIWVADANNDRLVALNDALEIIRVLDDPVYGFNGPRYLDFDSAARMYVADKYSHRIAILAADGSLIRFLGNQQGKGQNVFDRPEGVEIRGRDVWFSDTYNDRIVRYRITE